MNKTHLLQFLKARGFSKQILNAFEKVKREDFIIWKLKHRAYEDRALPIGKGQTISQPYTIAMMLELLKPGKDQKVLEIGSGSGYVLALLSEIVETKGKVYGIEVVKELAHKSKENLQGYTNIKVYNKNGSGGLPKAAPFDRILISAAIEEIPGVLLKQLKNNGLLVAPVGVYGINQDLTLIQRKSNKFITKKQIPGFVFVPFVD